MAGPAEASPNWDARPPGTEIDMLVIHYTGMPTAEAALARLRDPAAKVSTHYLVHEDGAVVSLVPESERAWHAGVSYWRSNADINARSIGIELVNPGHEFGYRPFPEPQMAALEKLAQGILERHPIPPRNVVGHSDVAPDRKEDPGELFDWRRLAAAGIGLWPRQASGDAAALADLLRRIGYDPAADRAIAAFQRRYRPGLIDNQADDETAGLAAGLLAAIG